MHPRLIFIAHAAWELSFPTAPNLGAWAGHMKVATFFGWRARDLVPACFERVDGVCEVRVLELVSSTEFIARTPRKTTTPSYNLLMEVLCPAS